MFKTLHRRNPLWGELYNLRQRIEGLFKSLKQSRRLEAHCYRGFKRVSLHAAMSILAIVSVRLQRNQLSKLRWMEQSVP